MNELLMSLAPVAVLVAMAVLTAIGRGVAKVLKDKLNIEIDAQMSALLHDAIERSLQSVLLRAGGVPAGGLAGAAAKEVTDTVIEYVTKTNPDAVSRFGLDRDKLRDIVLSHIK